MPFLSFVLLLMSVEEGQIEIQPGEKKFYQNKKER